MLAVPRPLEGVCGGAKKIWLRLTTASAQCLHLSERFFIHFSNIVCRILAAEAAKERATL